MTSKNHRYGGWQRLALTISAAIAASGFVLSTAGGAGAATGKTRSKTQSLTMPTATLPSLPAPSLPSLPASTMPALPSLPNLQLPSAGSLNSSVGQWSDYFNKQVTATVAGATSSLGIPSEEAGFAASWAKAESEDSSALTSLPTPALESISQLQSSIPSLSTTDVPALPQMAAPVLTMPALPTLPENNPLSDYVSPSGSLIPDSTSLTINPYYADPSAGLQATMADEQTCAPGPTGSTGVCAFNVPTSNLMAYVDEAAGTVAGLGYNSLAASRSALNNLISTYSDSTGAFGSDLGWPQGVQMPTMPNIDSNEFQCQQSENGIPLVGPVRGDIGRVFGMTSC